MRLWRPVCRNVLYALVSIFFLSEFDINYNVLHSAEVFRMVAIKETEGQETSYNSVLKQTVEILLYGEVWCIHKCIFVALTCSHDFINGDAWSVQLLGKLMDSLAWVLICVRVYVRPDPWETHCSTAGKVQQMVNQICRLMLSKYF